MKNIVLKINANKHVKTALFNDQSREKLTMQFQVVLSNNFDKIFFSIHYSLYINLLI
jgi:hypothetical protein